MKLKLPGLLLLLCMFFGMCQSAFAKTHSTINSTPGAQSALLADYFSGASEGLLPIVPEVAANNSTNCNLPYPFNKEFTPNNFKGFTKVLAAFNNYSNALQPGGLKQLLPIYIWVRLLLI